MARPNGILAVEWPVRTQGGLSNYSGSNASLGAQRHSKAYALHRGLLRLRGRGPVFGAPQLTSVDSAVLGDDAVLLRFFDGEHLDRRLLINPSEPAWHGE